MLINFKVEIFNWDSIDIDALAFIWRQFEEAFSIYKEDNLLLISRRNQNTVKNRYGKVKIISLFYS